MRSRFLMILFTLSCVTLPVHAGLLGASAYTSFASSPFSGVPTSWFYLETFEDGLLNTPGISVEATGGYVAAPGVLTDSVDGDDGVIDGSGAGGHSYSAMGGPGVAIRFNIGVLGALPTLAGVVWTDGFNAIRFEAWDQNDFSLGTLSGSHADGSYYGSTAEDRFYGVANSGGISKILIFNGGGVGIEIAPWRWLGGEGRGSRREGWWRRWGSNPHVQ